MHHCDCLVFNFVYSYIPETTFHSKKFIEGNNIDLRCSLTFGSFSTITLSKVKSDELELLAAFNSNGSTKVFTRVESRTNREEEQGLTLFTLTLINGGCNDRGTYRCSHDNGQMSEGAVDIISEFFILID